MSAQGDDCYFYYYSSCSRGDGCSFRHQPASLGSEDVCTLWLAGNCYRPMCKFRHMEIQKDRSKIACYWELKPGGCSKPHCPFMHFGAKALENLNPATLSANSTNPVCEGLASDLGPRIEPIPRVEPIVVKFDEESDQESVTGTPSKSRNEVNIVTALPKKAIFKKEVSHQVAQSRGTERKVITAEPTRRIVVASDSEENGVNSMMARHIINQQEPDYEENQEVTSHILSRLASMRDEHSSQQQISVSMKQRLNMSNQGQGQIQGHKPASAGGIKSRLALSRKKGDDETGGIKSRLAMSKKQGDDETGGIKSRLAMSRKQDDDDLRTGGDVKSRLTLSKPQDQKVSLVQGIKPNIKSRLQLGSSNKFDSAAGDGPEPEVGVAIKTLAQIRQEKGLKPKQKDSDIGVKIKSLAQIRREKALKQKQEVNRNPEKLKSGPQGMKQKAERQLYKPPGSEIGISEVEEKKLTKISPGKRKANKSVGVKTFSEIMAEKRAKREAENEQQTNNMPEMDDCKPAKIKKTFTPVVFETSPERPAGQIQISNTSNSPQPENGASKNFTPVVFNEQPSDSTNVRNNISQVEFIAKKNFIPIVFGDEKSDSSKGAKVSKSQALESSTKKTFAPIVFSETSSDSSSTVTTKKPVTVSSTVTVKSKVEIVKVKSDANKSLVKPLTVKKRVLSNSSEKPVVPKKKPAVSVQQPDSTTTEEVSAAVVSSSEPTSSTDSIEPEKSEIQKESQHDVLQTPSPEEENQAKKVTLRRRSSGPGQTPSSAIKRRRQSNPVAQPTPEPSSQTVIDAEEEDLRLEEELGELLDELGEQPTADIGNEQTTDQLLEEMEQLLA